MDGSGLEANHCSNTPTRDQAHQTDGRHNGSGWDLGHWSCLLKHGPSVGFQQSPKIRYIFVNWCNRGHKDCSGYKSRIMYNDMM